MGNKLEKLRKIKDRMRDELFIFKHAHLVKAMIESTEDYLVKKEECDEHSRSIAFRPTGGFGDYIDVYKRQLQTLIHSFHTFLHSDACNAVISPPFSERILARNIFHCIAAFALPVSYTHL